MGFDATFFTRINEDDQRQRKLERDEEFVWKPKFAFDDYIDEAANTGILGHLTYDGYGPPSAIPINWLKDMWAGNII